MSWLGRLLRGDSEFEDWLRGRYVAMYCARGMSRAEAREIVVGMIQRAKEKDKAMSPEEPNFGYVILQEEKTNKDIKKALAKSRREGATDDDIIQYYNQPRLARLTLEEDDRATRMLTFTRELEQGTPPEEAAAIAKNSMLNFGDPDDQTQGTGEDRPFPVELSGRVVNWLWREVERDPRGAAKRTREASSVNALARKALRDGKL